MANPWEQRYQEGETPWEKGEPHPELHAFLRRQPMHGRVLVPGCGFGHDVRAIAATADEVVGLDIAPSAVSAAQKRPQVGGESYVVADLFALPARWRASFDWIFEHTCFCAIDPAQRGAYVEAVAGALAPAGMLLGIFYLSPQMDPGESGPPFATSALELDELFGGHFELLGAWDPAATHPGREGRELCRLLRKR